AKEAGYIETLTKMLPRAEEIDSKPIETASQALSSPLIPFPPLLEHTCMHCWQAKEAGYIETLAKMLPRAEEIDSKPVR
ncbi:unnamed protein product, partial [Closterium sp. Naga37s-1]